MYSNVRMFYLAWCVLYDVLTFVGSRTNLKVRGGSWHRDGFDPESGSALILKVARFCGMRIGLPWKQLPKIPDSLQIVPITFDELCEAQLEEVRVQEVFV